MYTSKYLRNRIVTLASAALIAGIGAQGAMAMEATYEGLEGGARAEAAGDTRETEVGGKVAWSNVEAGKGESARVSEVDVAGKVGPVLVLQRGQ